jgi:2-phospho-L-lactate/phosphoenolpyruvate guanylyltransferase
VAPVEPAVLIPVKAFHAAKARLAPTVTPSDRATLARWMAGRVIDAVRPLPTFVACDDDAVAHWAESLGATVLWGPGLGLNGAVDAGVETISGKGFDDVIISHGDLPLPRSLPTLARSETVVIVPDRRRDGTNVIARPCAITLPASYGRGSFHHHLHQALASGCRVTVRYDIELSLDLDTIADLNHPMIQPVVAGALAR